MKPKPIAIGFWRSDLQPNLPDPRSHIDDSWDPREREIVVRYLKEGEHIAQWRGMSRCRICDVSNGSQDLGDGKYLWPSGYAHYIEKHHVKPPSGFLQHLRDIGVLR